MQYTHIIWDFNGTILDDLAPGIEVLNTLLVERSLPKITKEHYLQVFGFPIKAYYEALGFDFSTESYSALADEWSVLYREASKNCGLCPGVRELIDFFDALCLPQYILSASEYGMLCEQLRALGIYDRFTELLALRDFHAASKVELGLQWAAKHKPEKPLLIGDTTHDCETAAAIGADCMLIAAGHQCKERLLSCGVPVFDTARELLSYLWRQS